MSSYDVCLIGAPSARLTAQARALQAAGWRVGLLSDGTAPAGIELHPWPALNHPLYRVVHAAPDVGRLSHAVQLRAKRMASTGRLSVLQNTPALIYQVNDLDSYEALLWLPEKPLIVFDMLAVACAVDEATRLPELLVYAAALLTDRAPEADAIQEAYGVPRPLVIPAPDDLLYSQLYARLLDHAKS
ncbi:MAG: hypothetical protein ACLFTK_10445 [Anaerolineales bacterium]